MTFWIINLKKYIIGVVVWHVIIIVFIIMRLFTTLYKDKENMQEKLDMTKNLSAYV